MEKQDILNLQEEALETALQEMGQPKYRAGQVFNWLHAKKVKTFTEMRNLPKTLQAVLEENYYIGRLEMLQKQVSKDGTVKYLFGLQDENAIETVVMRYHHGNSICVSTQVGCRMGCRFCASTVGGLVRNLSAGEILQQVYTAAEDLGEPMSSVVLMGIGEPLDNLDNVTAFLRLLSAPNGNGLGQRSVSLSTCGVVPGIDALANEKFGLTLSVSLHAPNDEIRSRMMPVNDAYNIKDVLNACKRYQKATGRRISFEYTAVEDVNDRKEHAVALAKQLKGIVAHVNLIPLNTAGGAAYSASSAAKMEEFKEQLIKNGIETTVRRRLGDDISAACGQLRSESREGKLQL